MSPEEVKELLAENAALHAEVAGLWQRLAGMTQQLQAALVRTAELEQGKPELPAFVRPNRPTTEPKAPRQKRDPEHNTSRRRSQPTRIERHVLGHCPDCGYRLSGESIDYTREVIELPPPQPVEVIAHQVVKRRCAHCETWHSPKLELAGQVIGQGRIGVRVASLVSYLRTPLRLPFRAIQSYLATLHTLRLSVGELVELIHDVRQQLQPQADQLKAAVQTSTVTHGDETSWREHGQNGYAWAFVTAGAQAVRYFEFAHSRSHLVAQRILGADWRGWLVTDFYAAYNLIPGRHQRCWSHLLRDLHDFKQEQGANPEVAPWVTDVRKLYDEAYTWLAARCIEYDDLFTRACRLGERYALTYDHPCCALARRVLRHQDELFQFVLVPGLPADNNLAERSIRPLVIMPKISGGTRSAEGTKTRLTLACLIHTWAAHNLNPFSECLAAQQKPTAAPSP